MKRASKLEKLRKREGERERGGRAERVWVCDALRDPLKIEYFIIVRCRIASDIKTMTIRKIDRTAAGEEEGSEFRLCALKNAVPLSWNVRACVYVNIFFSSLLLLQQIKLWREKSQHRHAHPRIAKQTRDVKVVSGWRWRKQHIDFMR